MAWGVVEEHEFRVELNAVIPDPRESDEILRETMDHLMACADIEPQLDGTGLYYKTIPYPKIGRIIVIWYTIEDRVVLRSATSFKIPDDPI